MERVTLGTAGHIDHGKTALVRALTGVDTDRLPEEKARGITIDLGFAHLDLDGVRVGVVDVPGHERFVRNMLAGAAGIDLAMLVIAADDSIMPQTREHMAILELLGVEHGLIALTKCDLVEQDWVDLVEQDVREFVDGTFLEHAPIVQTSATKGQGIDALRDTIRDCAMSVKKDQDIGPFRLAIDRAFVKEGLGTVVTGTVWSGSLGVGEEVQWLPTGKRVRVRGVQSHGESPDRVTRGSRAAINLADVHHSEISRGHELATPDLLRASRLLSVELRVLAESPLPIRHRSRVRLHLGTGEVIAGVRLLESTRLEPGQRGLAQLVCAEPVAPSFGQALVIRAESPMVTLGGGRVLQPTARPIRRRDSERIEWLRQIREASPQDRVALSIWFQGERRCDEHDIARDTGLAVLETRGHIEALRLAGRLIEVGDRVMQAERVAALENRVVAAIESSHEASDNAFVPMESVIHRLAYLDEPVVRGIVARLASDKRLRDEGDRVALASHTPVLSEQDERLREAILSCLDDAVMMPPDPSAIATSLSAKPAKVKSILTECVREGSLVHLGGAIFLHERHYRAMLARLSESLAGSGELSVSQFREMMGTSRKYAVPILETLDKRAITRRRGDVRIAGAQLQAEVAT